MTDDSYVADKAADEIVVALKSNKPYPTDITKLTYDSILTRLRSDYPNLHPSVFLFHGKAIVQFSGFSSATFEVTGDTQLTRESFTADCSVVEGAQSPIWWPRALFADIKLLGWSLVPICLIGMPLFAVQSAEDLHGYFVVIAGILAVVFTLYAVLRPSIGRQNQQEWEDEPEWLLDQSYQAEKVIGVTAIGTIVICLLEVLFTTGGATHWDQEHWLLIGTFHITGIHWITIVLGVFHCVLLASFFRSIVFYYPDREFGQALLRIRNVWFMKQHSRAVKAQTLNDCNEA